MKYDLELTPDGTDMAFTDRRVSGIVEYRQACILRLSNDVTFVNLAFGIDLQNEIGQVGLASSLGVRASAAIANDERFSATLLDQRRKVVQGVEQIELDFDVVVIDTGETFSLSVLVANNEVRLVP